MEPLGRGLLWVLRVTGWIFRVSELELSACGGSQLQALDITYGIGQMNRTPVAALVTFTRWFPCLNCKEPEAYRSSLYDGTQAMTSTLKELPAAPYLSSLCRV